MKKKDPGLVLSNGSRGVFCLAQDCNGCQRLLDADDPDVLKCLLETTVHEATFLATGNGMAKCRLVLETRGGENRHRIIRTWRTGAIYKPVLILCC